MQGEDDKYWATKDGVTSADVSIRWSEPVAMNYVVIEEHIALGQRVREFIIEAFEGESWREIASGTTIGYKRILPLEREITTDAIRIRFLDSRGPLTIARIAVY